MKSGLLYKQLTAFLFLAAVFASTFSNTFVVADYFINTTKYAKNCENKARPQLHCNGKCQLMKKLKQEENKDKQNPDRRMNNKNETLFFSHHQFGIISGNPGIKLSFASFNNNATKDISSCFFHPPQA